MYTYSFDPTGTLPANKIVNEAHTITVGNGANNYVIVPDATPFHGDSLHMVDANGDLLEENVHYYLTHPYPAAQDATGKRIFGTITMISITASGTFKMNYQTIGGAEVDNRANAIQSGLQNLNAVLLFEWSNAPGTFPATSHTHPLSGLGGAQEVLDALFGIKEALEAPEGLIQMDDVQDLGAAFVQPLLLALSGIEAAVLSNLGLSNTMSEMLIKMARLHPITGINVMANNFTASFGGFFHLKFGQIEYTPGAEPTNISWIASASVETTCIASNISVKLADPGAGVQRHAVHASRANVDGIEDVLIEYIDAHGGTDRVLEYWAVVI